MSKEAVKKTDSKLKKYRVYVEQINQTFVTVEAASREVAEIKGYAKWKREWAHSRVMSVEEVKK